MRRGARAGKKIESRELILIYQRSQNAIINNEKKEVKIRTRGKIPFIERTTNIALKFMIQFLTQKIHQSGGTCQLGGGRWGD